MSHYFGCQIVGLRRRATIIEDEMITSSGTAKIGEHLFVARGPDGLGKHAFTDSGINRKL
jgi:hypothetical protein